MRDSRKSSKESQTEEKESEVLMPRAKMISYCQE
jgi:hypothetical protein